MAVDPLSTLNSGLTLAVVGGLYGWLVAVPWSPFLLSERLRRLFAALPPDDWRASYALWMPLPAAVWGFVWGIVVPVSRELRPPTRASILYVAGVDGTVAATAASLLLWPVLLLYALPKRGVDWNDGEYGPKTALLAVFGAAWYLSFLVVPAYVLSLFAGFGDAFSAT